MAKYRNMFEFLKAYFKRLPIRLILRPLLRWKKLTAIEPGYSIVIACHHRFPEMLMASLKMFCKDPLPHLYETVIVFDAPKSDKLIHAEQRFANEFPELRIKCLFQTTKETSVSRFFSWGWIDCWLSYSKGLAEAKTKYVMLHDMDAMIVKKGMIEERYNIFRNSQMQFMGYKWYNCNGLTPEMNIPIIVEMFLDAEHLRKNFKPIDLFNKVAIFKGIMLDFDTLLYPEAYSSRRSVVPINEDEMVHPSQVISQFTYLANNKNYIPPSSNNLFFIPYFIDIANSDGHIEAFAAALSEIPDHHTKIPFYGYSMDMSNLSMEHFRWVCKQFFRIEQRVFGCIRPALLTYCDSIKAKIQAPSPVNLYDEILGELAPEFMSY